MRRGSDRVRNDEKRWEMEGVGRGGSGKGN